MTEPATEGYSVRLQSAVFGTAFFNGTTQSMGTQILVLLLLGYISSDSFGFLVGIVLASRPRHSRRDGTAATGVAILCFVAGVVVWIAAVCWNAQGA